MGLIVVTSVAITIVVACFAVFVWALRRDEGDIGITAMLAALALADAIGFFWLGRASTGWGW